MKVLVHNVNFSITVSLTILKLAGFWSSDDLSVNEKIMHNFYTAFIFAFFLGCPIISQIVDLFKIWGNIPLMTAIAFLFLTNLVHAGKIFNLLHKKRRILAIIQKCNTVIAEENSAEGRAIVKRCDRETTVQQLIFFTLTFISASCLFTSSSDNNDEKRLPVRAWYPYNISKSPAYELSYFHQVISIVIGASLNIAKDTLVTTLISQCRCRLKLLGLSLKTLCDDMHVSGTLTPHQEQLVTARLRACVLEHQAILVVTRQLQDCFSVPTFVQFAVSRIIICVTAFQLVSQTANLVRLVSMIAYLLNMMYQLLIYCYQGTYLSEESSEVALAAYESSWYTFPVQCRRSVLVVMMRTRRVIRIVAGGLTILSLDSFMLMIKASYSFFTLLQQVNE